MSARKQRVKHAIREMEADVASWMPKATEFPKVAQRVRLKGAHPQDGQVGVVVRFESVELFPEVGQRPVVRLDSGRECFITHPRDWEAV